MTTLLTVLHVAAAVFIVGPMTIMPMSTLRSLRNGDIARVHSAARIIRLMSYLSLITLVTGFAILGLVGAKWNLSITTPWVLTSVVLYLVALILTLAVIVPTYARFREQANSVYTRVAVSSGVAALSLVTVVILMVWRP